MAHKCACMCLPEYDQVVLTEWALYNVYERYRDTFLCYILIFHHKAKTEYTHALIGVRVRDEGMSCSWDCHGWIPAMTYYKLGSFYILCFLFIHPAREKARARASKTILQKKLRILLIKHQCCLIELDYHILNWMCACVRCVYVRVQKWI